MISRVILSSRARISKRKNIKRKMKKNKEKNENMQEKNKNMNKNYNETFIKRKTHNVKKRMLMSSCGRLISRLQVQGAQKVGNILGVLLYVVVRCGQ